jgi:hypothetical protein
VNLQKLLFEPTLVRSPLRVVQWWESRRLTYNAIVGGVGLFTITYVSGWLRILSDPGSWEWAPLILGTVVYGVSANLCYTLGWIVENLVERWMKRPIYGFGPALFRHGLVFSIGLTLLPAVLITVAGIATLFFGGR